MTHENDKLFQIYSLKNMHASIKQKNNCMVKWNDNKVTVLGKVTKCKHGRKIFYKDSEASDSNANV